MKMKELESRTGVGREAIRFYIREGILPEPEKPKRNVAYYTEDHVTRLRAIQHLKEERELSLTRIKSVLDSSEFGALTESEGLKGLERLLPALLDGVMPAPDRSRDDVLADGDVTADELDHLIDLGIVTPVERGDTIWIGFRDTAVLRKWGNLRRAGFSAERGYDIGTLQRFQEAVRGLAEYEVAQFLELFGGSVSTEEAADIAVHGIENANDIIGQLHIKEIMAQLARALDPQG